MPDFGLSPEVGPAVGVHASKIGRHQSRLLRLWRSPRLSLLLAACCWVAGGGARAADLTYLQSLLNATPAGGWVKASTTTYSSAWVTGPSGVPNADYANPGSIVMAWSSFAWDTQAGDLLLWGGGHANYRGNEMFVWQGQDGAWTRGSLPSHISNLGGATWLVDDSAAPQAAHTYDNNLFLPLNDLFITFGGAAFNTGSNFQVSDGSGGVMRAGPWVWDPTLADGSKVGGTTGSGYDTSVAGGHMWTNLQTASIGAQPAQFVQSATAYRQENGMDVVYLTAERTTSSSSWQDLYRYAVGDLRNGGTATWEKVGVAATTPSSLGAAAIDLGNALFVRTTHVAGASDLAVWDLDKANAAAPDSNGAVGVQLVFADGTPFVMTTAFGIDYDQADGRFYLWNGVAGGKVYTTTAEMTAAGAIASQWVITELSSATAQAPDVNSFNGVLGKWQYVAELGAFVALDEFSSATQDAGVWLYKPAEVAAVPEPGNWALLLAGLGVVLWRAKRRGPECMRCT